MSTEEVRLKIKREIWKITFFGLSLLSDKYFQNDNKDHLISYFEKKIKIDTNRFKTIQKRYRLKEEHGNKLLAQGYFIYNGFENVNVGTDIGYSYLNNGIMEIGTWQQKTDSFILAGTDTLIIFSNTFKTVFCHVEYGTNKKNSFSPGYVKGHAFEWTATNKLKTKTIKEQNGDIYVLHFDTLTGKISKKEKI